MTKSTLFTKIPKKIKVSTQQNIDGVIVKKKAGRPRKKGMGRYTIRLLKSLHRDISAYCEKQGIGISYFIQALVVDKFKELEKEKSK